MTPNLPDPPRRPPPGGTERLRPQIILGMVLVTALSAMGIFVGAVVFDPSAPEIVTAALAGGTAGLMALSMKVLEKD